MSDVRQVQLVFGPPGTGKTTTLLTVVDDYLHAGGDPARVGFVSFTRQATLEARTRAQERFNLSEDDLPHFRTLHSAAFRALGLTRRDVLTPQHYHDLAASLGMPLNGKYDLRSATVGFHYGSGLGDAALQVYALARARGTTVEEEWRRSEHRELTWDMVRSFTDALTDFKVSRHLMDFSDMLDACTASLDLDLLVIDEAQDLSVAQWQLARRLGRTTPSVVIAGDDDQAVYDWAGASGVTLQRLAGTRTVLPLSYRLPHTVKQLADRVVANISERVPKDFHVRPDAPSGAVRYLQCLEGLDVSRDSWLLLARHRRHLLQYVRLCRQAGVVYALDDQWSNTTPAIRAAFLFERLRRGERIPRAELPLVLERTPGATPHPGRSGPAAWADVAWPWPNAEDRPDWMQALVGMGAEEREYIRGLRRNHEPLHGPGRVRISTIHGAKGAEADHVALQTDVTRHVLNAFHLRPDPEWRVWYVGVTRARQSLNLIAPRTGRHWPGLGLAFSNGYL